MLYRPSIGDSGQPLDFRGQYDDLQGPVSQGVGNATLTFEQYASAPFKCYFFRHDQNDELNYVFQVRHSWKVGSPMCLHLHYTPMSTWAAADLTKDVYIQVNWCWVATGVVVPTTAVGWTTTNVTLPVAKADQFEDLISPLVTLVPGAGCKESSIARVQIIRQGTNALDTYNNNKTGGTGAANIALWDVDCHFQLEKAGTVTEYHYDQQIR